MGNFLSVLPSSILQVIKGRSYIDDGHCFVQSNLVVFVIVVARLIVYGLEYFMVYVTSLMVLLGDCKENVVTCHVVFVLHLQIQTGAFVKPISQSSKGCRMSTNLQVLVAASSMEGARSIIVQFWNVKEVESLLIRLYLVQRNTLYLQCLFW